MSNKPKNIPSPSGLSTAPKLDITDLSAEPVSRGTILRMPDPEKIPGLARIERLPGSKKRQLAAISAALAVLVGLGGFMAAHRNRDTFFDRTYINGVNISGQTADAVADQIIRDRNTLLITLTENGHYTTSGTPSDFGFSLDREAIVASVKEAQEKQRFSLLSAIGSLFRKSAITLDERWSCDSETLAGKVDSRNLTVDRVPTRDAELIFSEETGHYEVMSETYGNQFTAEDLNAWIKPQLDTYLSGLKGQESACLTLEIPSDLYRKPTVLQDDAELNAKCAALNGYADMVIEYTFGSKTRDLTFSTFKNWLNYSDGTVAWDESKIVSYVEQLAAETDTRGVPKDFVTTYGETIHFDDWQVDYGYRINQDAEIERLTEQLKANTSVSQDPIYYKTNKWDNPWYYSRDGLDDLNGTYIEVSIPDQHVWFYKNGELIVEGDCVTGNHAKKMDTTPGVYPITYKRSPAVLKGGTGSSHYETPVSYWMPFNGGQGLHDATWRGSFGGRIYRSSGSHGCVNLPKKVARAIYENCSAGMPVVVYN